MQPMRFLKSIVIAFLLGLGSQAIGAGAGEEKQPNIIVIMSDDMGWSDVGYHGSQVRTPNIDRLGKEGMQLDRFYAFPICSPTRTALMTGRSPIRSGILSPLGGDRSVPAEEHFIPESFRKAGYQTFMVGKWHLGRGEGYEPQDRGFDHFYGFLGGAVDYYEHGRGRSRDWQRNGKTVVEEGYSTDLFAKEAVQLLKGRNKERTVFLYLPFNAPHGPFQAPDDLIEDYRGKGFDSQIAARAASITAMDGAIGKVLVALDDEEMTENTVVLFFCDNGAGGRSQRGGRGRRAPTNEDLVIGNTPLRSGKGSVYEGGIRVPAVMRWPAQITPGSKCDTFVSVLDVLPSLADAASVGVDPPNPLDGTSVWQQIVGGEEPADKSRSIVVASQRSRAVLADPWKLVQEGESTSLFNVRKDASESDDVSGDHQELVARLKESLAPFEQMLEKSGRSTSRSPRRRGSRRNRSR